MALSTPHDTFDFLSLPREIRYMIYDSLLLDESPAPESHRALSRRSTTTIFPFWQLDTRFIHVPPHVSPEIQNLLASNSQVRTEIQAKFRTYARTGNHCKLKYHLDVIVVGDVELFPSWRILPAPVQYMTKQLFQLDVRSSGSIARGKGAGTGLGRWNNSAFKVLELVEEFFNRGPTFKRVSEIREDIKVDTVLVNVVEPDNMPKDEVGGGRTKTGRKRKPTRLPNGSMHPLAMYSNLTDHLHSFQRVLQGRARVLQIRYGTQLSEHQICM